MSFQFIHFDTYARKGVEYTRTIKRADGSTYERKTTKRSLGEILDEQARIEGSCPHVEHPSKPGLLYGVPPLEVLTLAEKWAENTKDSRGYKLKSDASVCVVGVASLPREMEDDFPQFAEDTLEWLKEKYGDRLKSVVVHNDEDHPHLHFCIVPNEGEKFEDIHEGTKAKNLAKKNKEKGKAQNLAYISAMREIQDDFHNQVGIKNGLTRLGPGRRRLSRPAWKAEKAQAKAFANSKAWAKKGYKAGVAKGIAAAKEEAAKIIAEAQEQAKGFGVKVGGVLTGLTNRWHQPSAHAIAEAQKLQQEADRALQEAEKKKKKAEIYKQEAKKWADDRVAKAGNLLTVEKGKTKDLEGELDKVQEQVKDLGGVVSWYEKKFGKAPAEIVPK